MFEVPGAKFKSPLYTASTTHVPNGNEEVVKLASPPLNVPVPSTVVPFMKLTVSPSGGAPALRARIFFGAGRVGKVHENAAVRGQVPFYFARGRLSPAFGGFGITSGFRTALPLPAGNPDLHTQQKLFVASPC